MSIPKKAQKSTTSSLSIPNCNKAHNSYLLHVHPSEGTNTIYFDVAMEIMHTEMEGGVI